MNAERTGCRPVVVPITDNGISKTGKVAPGEITIQAPTHHTATAGSPDRPKSNGPQSTPLKTLPPQMI